MRLHRVSVPTNPGAASAARGGTFLSRPRAFLALARPRPHLPAPRPPLSARPASVHSPWATTLLLDAAKAQAEAQRSQQDPIHISIERGSNKSFTLVQGLPARFDPKVVLNTLKSKCACIGGLVEDMSGAPVLYLQGDWRRGVHDFMVDAKHGLGVDARSVHVSVDDLDGAQGPLGRP